MYEDQLPEDITNEEYNAWYDESWVEGGIRIGPDFLNRKYQGWAWRWDDGRFHWQCFPVKPGILVEKLGWFERGKWVRIKFVEYCE